MLTYDKGIVRTFNSLDELVNFVNTYYLVYGIYPVVEVKGDFRNHRTRAKDFFIWRKLQAPIVDYLFIVESDYAMYDNMGAFEARFSEPRKGYAVPIFPNKLLKEGAI